MELGEGPHGFILVHGMGGCWQHWKQTLAFLASRGRALALDLPGFGHSQRLPGPVSLERFADLAAHLCERAELRRVVFLGHSMGGPIGLHFASRRPDLARALVLVAGAVRTFSAVLGRRELGHLARTRRVAAAATFAEVLGASLPTPTPLKGLIADNPLLCRLALWPYLYRPSEISAEGARTVLEGAGALGVLPTARALGRVDPYEQLAEVRCPILSIGARHDRICPPADLRHFERISPEATSAVVEGAGHMVMLERPVTFNQRLGRFLDEHGYAVRAGRS